jgi:WD40 repeat protein
LANNIEINLINLIEAPHKNQINSLVWNSSDTLILTASKDKLAKVFDPITGVCKLTLEGHEGMVSSAVFVDNETKILTSGLDYKISLWDIQGKLEYSVTVPNITVSEILYSASFNFVILISATTNSILIYDISTKLELDRIPMNDAIVSCAISKLDNGEFLLVNSSKATPVLNLLNLKNKKFVRKYFGHRQERFTIKCNFGGENENFLLCGSEDAKIYIWNRNHSIPIYEIKAHTSPVNAVIWSHCYYTDLIISCSDDHTIKILSNDNVDKIYYFSDKVRSLEHKFVNFDENKLEVRNNTNNTTNNNNSNNTSVVVNTTRNLLNIFASLTDANFSPHSTHSDEEI